LFGTPERSDLVVGSLHTTAGGFGFVSPDGADRQRDKDVFIPPGALADALHGDRVAARVERRTDRGFEGRIERVLTRKHQRIVGRLDVGRRGQGVVVPFDRRVLADVRVEVDESLADRDGQMVVVDVTAWPAGSSGPEGRVAEVLGPVDAPGVDTQVIIRSYGIPDEYPDEAVAEARRLGDTVREQD